MSYLSVAGTSDSFMLRAVGGKGLSVVIESNFEEKLMVGLETAFTQDTCSQMACPYMLVEAAAIANVSSHAVWHPWGRGRQLQPTALPAPLLLFIYTSASRVSGLSPL
jgi:hypothetical protein